MVGFLSGWCFVFDSTFDQVTYNLDLCLPFLKNSLSVLVCGYWVLTFLLYFVLRVFLLFD
ncbi:unnamed protein product [Meloidogyne enterolobii]|uniref:Uncharacterized protein n=1 Tax=Meloidogyne enterolobii TaxID=390850 RepID=A0ACB0ZEQ6_MELEN